MANIVQTISQWAIPFLLLIIPTVGILRGVKVYESFVSGAEEGFQTAVRIIPFLVGMLVAINVFRISGAFKILADLIAPLTTFLHIPADVIPLAVMRPLSGSGALGLTAEIIKTFGPDSFLGKLASTMQGSTDTTFYVLTIYFGSVGIKRYRHAIWVGLSADITTFLASVIICNLYLR